MAGEAPFSFGNTVSLSATTSTGRVAVNLPASQQLVLTNLGPDLAYVAIGDVTVTATTSSFPLLPGTQLTVSAPSGTIYVAAICPTSTAAIKVTSADGILTGVGAASTGASGGVTDSVNLAQVAGTATVTGGVNGLLAVAGNAASGATDAGNPVKAGGVFNTTAPTLTNGQRGDLQLSSRGALLIQDGPYVLGRATADTQIKSGAGFIHTVTIGATGTVTAGVLTIYDSLTETGTVVFAVALPVTTFTPFSVILDGPVATGIYVGFDATLANVQATLSYR